MNLLESIVAFGIASGMVYGSTLQLAEISQEAVTDYTEQRQTDINRVLKMRAKAEKADKQHATKAAK